MAKVSIAESHPELAAQADGWDPTNIPAGSSKKMAWKCAKGHCWEAIVANRVKGNGCPVCAGQKVEGGINDLGTLRPDLAKEVDGWDPALYRPGSNQKLPWVCPKGHKWIASPNSRNRGSGCPACSNRVIVSGFNDLATLSPELAGEADGWDPRLVGNGSSKPLPWRCRLGHTWTAPPERRSGQRRGCPVCSGNTVQPGFNDLASRSPSLAAEADGWDPTKITGSSNRKMAWKCQLGHRWEAVVASRSHGVGCPVCANKVVVPGFNDLATTNPMLAAEADGWDAKTLTAGSSTKWSWVCSKGHRWRAVVASRNTGVGCPICDNKVVLPGFNDLATINPKLSSEADGWDPSTVTASSHRIMAWKCQLGHSFRAALNNRTAGKGCPYCSNSKVLSGFNDLATVFPEVAAEADGWDPSQVTWGSPSRRSWRCASGHSWMASISNRTGSIASGCPSCARSGFDPNKDGWIYFLAHDGWGLLQIGITNVPRDRLSTHQRSGWVVREVRGPQPGDVTNQWEQDILRALKRRGISLGPKQIAGRFSGYTESWIQEDFPAESIKQLMDLVRADEESL